MTQQEIGAKMKELRNIAGLSIEELAKRTGLNKSSINQMELGRQNMSIANLIRISNEIQAEIVVSVKI